MDDGVTFGGDIDGVRLTPLREIADARGAVLHMLRNDAPDFTRFGECYLSEVAPRAVKAWKRHCEQSQNLAVPVGRIRLVIFDDREGSPTRGTVQQIVLGRPDAYYRVSIPRGLWYGFAAVGGQSAMLVNCADLPHSTSESETRPLDDPSIPYTWSADTVSP